MLTRKQILLRQNKIRDPQKVIEEIEKYILDAADKNQDYITYLWPDNPIITESDQLLIKSYFTDGEFIVDSVLYHDGVFTDGYNVINKEMGIKISW